MIVFGEFEWSESGCSFLYQTSESIYMDAENGAWPINYTRLWGIIRKMENFKVLKVSIHLIPLTLGTTSLPSLKAFCLLYK